MNPVARMLDASTNRAREALRVMEDAARFALDDAGLCGELKAMRHDLRSALDSLPGGWLEANRDTPGDVGTVHCTPQEMCRSDILDIVTAAGKRLTESLRVIEEITKTLEPQIATRTESLRYRAYDVDSRLQLRFATGRARQWQVCVLLTAAMCNRPWRDVLRAAIEGGADCIQAREKEMPDADLLPYVREIIEVCRPRGVTVIVNDRVDIALATSADGVHLGQGDLPVKEARRIAGRALMIGVSTHDLTEARAAAEGGADYCGVGAMFDSPIKPGQTPSGSAYLRAYLDHYPAIPHLAIGGISPANIQQVVAAGARGVAVCSAVCGADDPGAAVRSLRGSIAAGSPRAQQSPAPKSARQSQMRSSG